MQPKTWVVVVACVCIAVVAVLLSLSGRSAQADEPKKDLPVPKAKMWAGLAVTSPTFGADAVTDARFFMVSFALVNDGDKNFAPTEEVNTSMLLINGKELKEWPHVINNGPREPPETELKTGESLRFGKAIGKYCTEPGIYKVQWKGKSFESAVVEFRVLPAKSR
jgi:hypothetical protein